MLDIAGQTIADIVETAATRFADNSLLIVPRDSERDYDSDGREITYRGAGALIETLANELRAAGYGHGHRLAVLLENRPENLLVKLACASLGVSWVPVNPDYRPSEIAYLLQDSGADLAISTKARAEQMHAGISASGA